MNTGARCSTIAGNDLAHIERRAVVLVSVDTAALVNASAVGALNCRFISWRRGSWRWWWWWRRIVGVLLGPNVVVLDWWRLCHVLVDNGCLWWRRWGLGSVVVVRVTVVVLLFKLFVLLLLSVLEIFDPLFLSLMLLLLQFPFTLILLLNHLLLLQLGLLILDVIILNDLLLIVILLVLIDGLLLLQKLLLFLCHFLDLFLPLFYSFLRLWRWLVVVLRWRRRWWRMENGLLWLLVLLWWLILTELWTDLMRLLRIHGLLLRRFVRHLWLWLMIGRWWLNVRGVWFL